MAISEILASLDSEIRLLQQARTLLAAGLRTTSGGAVKTSVKPVKLATKKKKRRLTPEGRRRIAEAVKRRWERQHKASENAAKK